MQLWLQYLNAAQFIVSQTLGKGAVSVAFVRPSVCLSVGRVHSE